MTASENNENKVAENVAWVLLRITQKVPQNNSRYNKFPISDIGLINFQNYFAGVPKEIPLELAKLSFFKLTVCKGKTKVRDSLFIVCQTS